MTNPVTGEVVFDVDGKSYTIQLGTYALAILQRRTNVPTLKFLNKKPEDWGVDDMLQIFYAGLYRKHKLAEEEVADLMDAIGSERLAEIVQQTITGAFGEAAKGTANPPQPMTNGSGQHSTANG